MSEEISILTDFFPIFSLLFFSFLAYSKIKRSAHKKKDFPTIQSILRLTSICATYIKPIKIKANSNLMTSSKKNQKYKSDTESKLSVMKE